MNTTLHGHLVSRGKNQDSTQGHTMLRCSGTGTGSSSCQETSPVMVNALVIQCRYQLQNTMVLMMMPDESPDAGTIYGEGGFDHPHLCWAEMPTPTGIFVESFCEVLERFTKLRMVGVERTNAVARQSEIVIRGEYRKATAIINWSWSHMLSRWKF